MDLILKFEIFRKNKNRSYGLKRNLFKVFEENIND